MVRNSLKKKNVVGTNTLSTTCMCCGAIIFGIKNFTDLILQNLLKVSKLCNFKGLILF